MKKKSIFFCRIFCVILLINLIGFLLLSSFSTINNRKSFKNPKTSSNRTGVKIVVIDAGHGGKDPGCLGHRGKEKDVTLAIALALGHDIEKNCPDVKVIYTRNDDNFVELFQRAEIANRNKADLFISIHCNSSPSPAAYGVETYVMGLYKSQANLNVAKKENSSILLENDYKKNYGGFDPNSAEAYIIFSLYQNVYIDESIELASKIEKQVSNAGRYGRGVKQAGFLVIYKTTMPSMLVEAGFLTNPNEEEFLLSEAGQNTIANSIFKAFKEYKNEREGKAGSEKINEKNENSNTEVQDSDKHDISKQTVKPVREVVKKKMNDSADVSEKSGVQNKHINNQGGVIFKVQFATSPVKKDFNSKQLKDLGDVDYYTVNGIYKYTIGNEKKLSEAKKILSKMKENGYKDAFIIAFSDGKRLKSISEALNLQKK